MTRKILLLIATLSICYVLGEVALRQFTPFPTQQRGGRAFDERLSYVLDSRIEDVDETGFRNPAVPERVDIVAIGDSFTYGNNVSWQESWPYQLARMTGRSVYNFGIGGYGVYQYYQLFIQALKFRPKHILVAFFVPNDLRSRCLLLDMPHWRGVSAEHGLETRSCEGLLGGGEMLGKKLMSRLKAIIPRSATRSAFRYFRREYFPGDRDVYTVSNGSASILVSKTQVTAVFRYTDLDRPGIAQTFLNSKILFDRMISTANDRGINIGFIFIPSKSRVSHKWALREGVEVADGIFSVAKNEDMLLRLYREYFDERGVKTVDAIDSILAAFDQSVVGGDPVYKNNGDNHPLAAGYEAYARAAMALLR